MTAGQGREGPLVIGYRVAPAKKKYNSPDSCRAYLAIVGEEEGALVPLRYPAAHALGKKA